MTACSSLPFSVFVEDTLSSPGLLGSQHNERGAESEKCIILICFANCHKLTADISAVSLLNSKTILKHSHWNV